MSEFDRLRAEAVAAIDAAADAAALEAVRVGALGRKGTVTALMKNLGTTDAQARRGYGAQVNALKDELTQRIEARRGVLADAELSQRLQSETIDLSLPARPEPLGRIHPISQTIDEIIAIFGEMGFSVAEGPDIEDDFHNFTALNFPVGHPARDMHDTFYLPDGPSGQMLLRTHTSPVQVRTMMNVTPPIRVIIPGRT